MLSIFDGIRDVTALSVAIRMFLAVACGGAIGIERSYKRRPAGFRTHILICLGASIATLTSQYLFLNLGYYTDMGRLGAQVIAGVGFIGAGAILVTRQQRVKGLTTAAGLWSSAIIGLALGGGFYEGGILATVILLIVELIFPKIELIILENVPEMNLYMEYSGRECLNTLIQTCHDKKIKIMNMQVTRPNLTKKHNACVIVAVRLNKNCSVKQFMQIVSQIEGVISAREL